VSAGGKWVNADGYELADADLLGDLVEQLG
jgi:hypothetical protein